jgi:predicted nucleic acid-binding protein
MVTFYFDTSAIVKRYHKEIGSDVLDRIFELKVGFVTSLWTILEFIVAFSFMVRRKELSRETFNTVISLFLKEVLDMFIITSVNDELIASATLMATKHPLPSADCLQLASVKSLSSALELVKERVVLVCSDKELCKAAKKEGIEFINPEEKDTLKKLDKMLS